jgi:hypothetical protein
MRMRYSKRRQVSFAIVANKGVAHLVNHITQCKVLALNYAKSKPIEVQRYVLQLVKEGYDEKYIRQRTGLSKAEVRSITKHRIITPKPVPEYRCEGCGGKVECVPCPVCELNNYLKED